MIIKKNKKVCKTLNYIEIYFLNLGSTITGHVSISAFTFIVGVSVGNTSSVMGLKIYLITVGIKKYMLLIKIKKHDKIIFLAKSKLNRIEVLIAKVKSI